MFWYTVLAGFIGGLAVVIVSAATRSLHRRRTVPQVDLRLERVPRDDAALVVVLIARNNRRDVARGLRHEVEIPARLKPRSNVDTLPQPTAVSRKGEEWLVFPMHRDARVDDVGRGDVPLALFFLDVEPQEGDALLAKAWLANGLPTTSRLRLDRALPTWAG